MCVKPTVCSDSSSNGYDVKRLNYANRLALFFSLYFVAVLDMKFHVFE